MQITEADSVFETMLRKITNLFTTDTVDQAAIDMCCTISLANSADIRTTFAAHGGFIGWYNSTLASPPAFMHRCKIRTDAGVARRQARPGRSTPDGKCRAGPRQPPPDWRDV
jgi:hypothetical protein